MGVRVLSKDRQAEGELGADEAQAEWLEGRVALPEGKVAVKRGMATGEVDSRNLASALAEGWELSDETERADLTMRRQESDATSLALGSFERALSGATLGGSTWLQAELGGDEERQRMAARAEELGGFGDALELAGAILPGALSGGATAGVTAEAGVGRLLARGLTAPARLASRGGAALERQLVRSTGSQLVGTGGRGFAEGVVFGEGQLVDESALGGREITAEQLMANGFAAGLLGGAGSVAGSMLLPGLAKVGAGAVAAPVRGMQRVLGRSRASGVAREIAEAHNDRGLLDDVVAMQNRAFGDEAAGDRLMAAIRADSKFADDVMRNEKGVTEGVAKDVQRAWNLVDDEADDLMAASLVLKPERLRQVIPRELDLTSPRESARFVGGLRQGIDDARAYNLQAPGTYLGKEIDRLDGALASASHELGEGVDAAHAMITLAKARSKVGEVVRATGGFGKRGQNVSDAAWETNRAAREMYGKIRDRLRDRQWWGDGADLQAGVDDAISAFHGSRDTLRETFRGGFGGTALTTGQLSADQAVKLTRSFGRFGGAEKVNALEDLLDKRLAMVRSIREHMGLDETAGARMAELERGVGEIKGALGKNAKKAAIVDDMQLLRDAQTDKSPTSSIFSTLGSPVLGLLGLAGGGPLGAAAGMVLGAATRPHTTMKAIARLRALGWIDDRSSQIGDRMSALVKRTTDRIGGKPAASTGRVAGVGAAQMSAKDRRERERKVAQRAAEFATNPAAIGELTKVAMYDVDEHAPGLGAALRQYGQIAATYLAKHAPQHYGSAFIDAPKTCDPIELDRYARRVEAILEPMETLERGLDDGSLTPEHVDAIRSVYPQIYAEAQQEIVGAALEAAGRGDELPYSVRVRLGILFDLPLDPSITPDAIMRTHGAHAVAAGQAQAQQMGGGGRPPGRPGQVRQAGTMQTDMDKLQGGQSI